MQTSTNSHGKKLNGKLKNNLRKVQTAMYQQPDLTKSLKEVVDTEMHIFDVGAKQAKNMAKYLSENWKTAIPALAALGVSAYLLRSSPKRSVK